MVKRASPFTSAPPTVAVTVMESPSVTPASAGRLMVSTSSSATAMAAALTMAVSEATASGTVTATLKFSAASFKLSPARVTVNSPVVSAAPQAMLPLVAAKSASAVPAESACAISQFTVVAAAKAAPLRVTVKVRGWAASVSVTAVRPATLRVRAWAM